MRKRSNIVSFDEARKSSKRRHPPQEIRSREEADSHKLSMIFELDFGNEADEPFDRSSHSLDLHDDHNKRRRRTSRASQSDRLAQAPRSAITRFDAPGETPSDMDADEFADESDAPAKTGFFEARKQKQRQKAKARAEKQFNKAYGSSGSISGSTSSDAGPRAALYAGEMGAKQRLATRMQDREQRTGVSFSFPILSRLPQLPKWPKPVSASIGVLLSVVLLVCMVYTPAQQYYHQLRERDRLSAEYTVLVQRNDTLQSSVDALQTEEGVEDKAHSEFGLVREGEQAGSVTGIDVPPSNSKFTANVAPGSVPAPETWYSPVLDVIFFYTS